MLNYYWKSCILQVVLYPSPMVGHTCENWVRITTITNWRSPVDHTMEFPPMMFIQTNKWPARITATYQSIGWNICPIMFDNTHHITRNICEYSILHLTIFIRNDFNFQLLKNWWSLAFQHVRETPTYVDVWRILNIDQFVIYLF